MASETIDDIVREMHEHIGNGLCLEFADRIEAAAKATVRTDNTEVLHNLLAENARLRTSLSHAVSFIADNAEFLGADCNTTGFIDKCRKTLAKSAGESEATNERKM